ncbi:MAG TPA: head-tail connector protein [Parvularculaceae bacterium]|nr:head-tail connector protein [Parvularculaceae bacterium]
MSLDLITPPTEEPVSLAELKAHLRIAHDDDDAAITSYALAARRAVEARAGIALIEQGWRLTLDRAPQGAMLLPRAPVFAIDAVQTVDRDGDTDAIDADLFDFEPGAPARFISRGLWPYSDRLIAGVRIDFTAGWAGAEDVPEELRLAVQMLAAHFYENREGAQPERVFAVPQAVDALLAPWRRVRL